MRVGRVKKWKVILLIPTVVILWDISLHICQLFKVQNHYPLYPHFTSWMVYDIFWVSVLSIVLIILIIVVWKAK